MPMLRFLTAGESHGRGLIGIIEGIPSGLLLSTEDIDEELRRRQQGYGRGGRMRIEEDRAIIISGVRWGRTIGSPISLSIENRDWKNWREGMSPEAAQAGAIPPVTRPRPGHADLSGALKYAHRDVRNVLERSSARETAMRVGLGAVAKRFLSQFGIRIYSYVVQIGSVKLDDRERRTFREQIVTTQSSAQAESSPVRCPSEHASREMTGLIDEAARRGDSLGGIFEVIATGIPAGLGSYIQWDRRLDGRLSQALMTIQAIKGVEIGEGFEMAGRFGSEVMDEIFFRSEEPESGFFRMTNNAGGIEGGMTNGMPLMIRAAMKPIPTLRRPLRTVDIETKEPVEAAYERSDICAVPAAAVIAEAMTALVVAGALIEKCGGDNMEETRRNFDTYAEYLKSF